MKRIIAYPTLFLLLTTLLTACSPSGPVKTYSGPDRTNSEIALVKIPGPVTVTRVDGRKIDAPSKEEGYYELHLLPGQHSIDFKYALFWGDGTSGMMIKSDIQSVVSQFDAGRVYELTYKEPASQAEAFDLAMDFKATLVAVNGGTQVASKAPADNRTSGYTPSPASSAPVVDTATPMPSAQQASREDAVKRLKFWWLMASEKEREEFRSWLQTDMPNFNQQ